MKRITRLMAAPCCFAFLFVSATLAFCQDSLPASLQQSVAHSQLTVTSDDQKHDEQSSAQMDLSSQSQPDVADVSSVSLEKPVINLSTGQSFSKSRSPFHLGRLSVMSFEATQIYDSNYLFHKDNILSAQAGAVQGLFVYTIKTDLASFNLQYRPQLWVSGESHQFDYSSHMLDLHMFKTLSPYWAVNVSGQFQFAPQFGRLDQIGFSPDYSTGTSTQNPFLSVGERMVNNDTGMSVAHRLSAHDTLDIAGDYRYIHVSPNGAMQVQNPAVARTEQQDVGGHFGWTHTWHGDDAFGIQYSHDHQFFPGAGGAAQLNGILFAFSRRVRPSLLLRLGGGPSVLVPAKLAGSAVRPDSQLTYQASAALYKTFRHSGLTLSYSRNNSFTGQISDSLNDRLDGSYSQRLFRRLDVVLGTAFVHQGYLNGAHLNGTSSWSELSWHLNRSWSMYTSYSYMTQAGSLIPYGPRQLVMAGIRWNFDFARGQAFGK